MTQAAFNELPGLLPRKLFQQITGLSDHDLDEMRRTGELTVFYSHAQGMKRGRNGHKSKKSYAKYYKRDAARIGGFTL
jgi:hypothetical protein